jgi:putative transcriptional regulator
MLLNLERVNFLIAQYVSGTLPEAARVLVGSHLQMQAGAGQLAHVLEDLAGEALDRIDPVPLASRHQSLEKILRSDTLPEPPPPIPDDGELPSLLRAYAGKDLEEVPWRMKLPGLRQYMIEKSRDVEASLLWARPGRALPHHRHRGLELTLVLDGEFRDHRGHFGEGDVSVADESLDHRPVAGAFGPCVCFSVLFAPIAVSGSPFRLLSDIIGL